MSDLAFDAKQPYEAYYVEFDFVNDIVDGDSISTATVAVKNGAVDVTDSLTNVAKQLVSGTVVSIWIMAGTTGITYVITCQIVTVNGEKYEAEADLPVLEK